MGEAPSLWQKIKWALRRLWGRSYLRGRSLLGVFNTISGILFNRVLVQMWMVWKSTGWRFYGLHWELANEWPTREYIAEREKHNNGHTYV